MVVVIEARLGKFVEAFDRVVRRNFITAMALTDHLGLPEEELNVLLSLANPFAGLESVDELEDMNLRIRAEYLAKDNAVAVTISMSHPLLNDDRVIEALYNQEHLEQTIAAASSLLGVKEQLLRKLPWNFSVRHNFAIFEEVYDELLGNR